MNKDLLYISTITRFNTCFYFLKILFHSYDIKYVKILKIVFLQMKTSEEKNTYIQSALDVLEGEGRVFTKQKSQVYGVMEY